MNLSFAFRASAFALLFGAALSAHALNLVMDGDFEQALPGTTGTIFYNAGDTFDAYWTVNAPVGIDTDDGFNLDGDKSLYLNPSSRGLGSVSQTLATVPNATYVLSFIVHNDAPSSFTVKFGDTTVLDGAQLPILAPSQYKMLSFVVTATSAQTSLGFSGASDSIATIELDDVSVTPQAVPEPASVAALGLGVVAWARRRRRA